MSSGEWQKHPDGSVICSALTRCAVQPISDGAMGLLRMEYLTEPSATKPMGIQFLVRTEDLNTLIGELQTLKDSLDIIRLAAAKPPGNLS
jgi:hypothetical protein